MLSNKNNIPQKPKRVVILGAKGFVGNTTLQKLTQENIEVLALGREELDLCEAKSADRLVNILREDDAVVVISAKAPCKNNKMMLDNIQIMQTVCDALARQKVSQVIYISSDAVYADSQDKLTETSPTAPDSLHGVMHLAREIMLKSVVPAENLVILRPSLLYGANDPHNGYGPNSFYRLTKTKDPIILFGKGEERRDHVYIEDVANIIHLCLMCKSYGILNITTGEVHSFHDIANLISKTIKETEIRYKDRNGPMPHNGYRAFDNQNLSKAFPDYKYTRLAEGIKKMHSQQEN